MNIQTYIKKHGLTQQTFADQCLVTQGTVANWLKRGVPIESLENVVKSTDGQCTLKAMRPDLLGLFKFIKANL